MTSKARVQTAAGQPLCFEGARMLGDLAGQVLELRLEQQYRNPFPQAQEVVYTFPLPRGAELLGLEAWLGERHLVGEVHARARAEAGYEQALSEGNSAILLERNADGTCSVSLGNLAPGESCRIVLRYARVLAVESGSLRLMLPTAIAPRYGDRTKGYRDKLHNVPFEDWASEYPVDLQLRIHGELAQVQVSSPSHALTQVRRDGVLIVGLENCALMDRDLVVVLSGLAQRSLAVCAEDGFKAGQQVVMAGFVPLMAVRPAALGVKLLVDCSGSMAGDSLGAARAALAGIIHGLGEGDRFSLSRFGSTVEHRSRGLWTLSEATRAAALRWVDGLEADLGGTEMESALASTFALAKTDITDVLLVTDGAISAVDDVVALARRSGHRLFVVGIGSSPAEALLRRLAEATKGACDFVAPGEAVGPAVVRMFARLHSPRLHDLALEWPVGVTPVWTSLDEAPVFAGDTVPVCAWVQGLPVSGLAPARTVRLTGRYSADGERMLIGEADLMPAPTADTTARLAAGQRASHLEHEDRTEAALELRVRYQLVSEQTSFLLVHERAGGEKLTALPQLHRVPQMLAAGWGGYGSVMPPACAGVLAGSAVRVDMMRGQTVAHSCVEDGGASGADYDLTLFRSVSAMTADRPGRRYRATGPQALVDWLLSHDRTDWPQTLAELNKRKLDPLVIEWLELTVMPALGLTETAVVGLFLTVLASAEVAVRVQAQGRALSLATDPGTDRMLRALDGIDASDWPDAVLAMTFPEPVGI